MTLKILDVELAKEAKAIVALAFRNGLIEDVHAGANSVRCATTPWFRGLGDLRCTIASGSGDDLEVLPGERAN